ncbi:MAG: TetR/AcrR family transcriptional regulator [Spirochaetes bacterium]|nr:TetR/AcrR family transcriptional regulator [Spirochaetota bacterium]MBU1078986.1 TetR/AcrR family transcriptional regulator [Spirochaetota bacterium]
MARVRKLEGTEPIGDAAFKIIDIEGYEAFTARHLAMTVGVATMTVYNYLSREEILRVVVRRAFRILTGNIAEDTRARVNEGRPLRSLLDTAEKMMDFSAERRNLYNFLFDFSNRELIHNESTMGLYNVATKVFKPCFSEESYRGFAKDWNLFFILADGVIRAYTQGRHGVDAEPYRNMLQRSFDLLLAPWEKLCDLAKVDFEALEELSR